MPARKDRHGPHARLLDAYRLEAVMVHIARAFVDRGVDQYEDCVTEALVRIGEATDADRAWVMELDGPSCSGTFEWVRPGIESVFDLMQAVPVPDDDWWFTMMRAGRPVVLRTLDDLPPEAATERAELEEQGVTSLAAVAMTTNGEVIGFVGIESVGRVVEWDDAVVATLAQVSATLTSARRVQEAEAARRASEAELREREQRFRMLLTRSSDIVIVLDADQRISYASPPVMELFGWDDTEIVGHDMLDFIHVDDRRRVVDAFAHVLGTSGSRRPIELLLRRRDGGYRPVEAVGSNLLDDPVIGGVVINLRDISERMRFEARVRDAQVAFERVFDESPIGMATTTPEGQYLRVNPALCDLLGYSQAELLASSVFELTHPDDRTETTRLLQELLDGRRRSYTVEKRYLRRDGNPIWVRLHASLVRDHNGDALYTVGHVEDITERRAYEEHLTHEATHDTLTGLAQRNLLLERLGDALQRARTDGTHVAVLFVDLDKFKRINDSFGHAAGDSLLVDAAHRLRAAGRAADTIGRFGGDEFVIVCPSLEQPADALAIAERIRREMEEPFLVSDLEVLVGASVGLATSTGDASAETILHHADTAAYRAKERGRNRIEVWDDDLREQMEQRLRIETALRHAIEARDQLVLRYQPIIDARTGRIRSFEALVRWQHPERGLLAPSAFLSVAEETGLIVPLGLEVLEMACAQLAAWHDGLPSTVRPSMSVNISARQLAQPDLVDDVRAVLWSSRVHPGSLCLEITESSLMHDTEETMRTLDALRTIGVQLAIDDFGTGYSSLSYLRRLPVGIVKIDRSFVSELGSDTGVSTIVASVIDLAHALGMSVVAEGVETSAQVDSLAGLGCDAMQGYYLSTPLTGTDATTLLRSDWADPARKAV